MRRNLTIGPEVSKHDSRKEIHMLKKSLVVASITACIAAAGLSTQASAGDPVLGGLVGAGIGAVIGHGVDGRNGAAVGGAIGAIAGASIAASSGPYYGNGYY